MLKRLLERCSVPPAPLFAAPANLEYLNHSFPDGLPAEYLAFARAFGSGYFSLPKDYELAIYNPFDPNYPARLEQMKTLLRGYFLMERDSGEAKNFLMESTGGECHMDDLESDGIIHEPPDDGLPRFFHPEPGGLLPLGTDNSRAILLWITSETRDWTIACTSPDCSDNEIYDMGLPEFLSSFFEGKLGSPIWAEFSNASHRPRFVSEPLRLM